MESCLKTNPLLLSGAKNFRVFENIIRDIDNYCRDLELTLKCAKSCNGDSHVELQHKLLLLDNYICSEKVEEFRVAKDCVQKQQTNSIDQCISLCDAPEDSALQLDILPAKIMDFTEHLKDLAPKCRQLECILKCSVKRMNQECAGSGELLKEISREQIMETSKRIMQNDANETSTKVQNMLQNLPDQCVFLANLAQFEELFDDEEMGAEMPTEVSTLEEVETIAPPLSPDNTGIKTVFGELDEHASTKIFDVVVEPDTTAATGINKNEDAVNSRTTEASIPEMPKETQDNSDASSNGEITDNSNDNAKEMDHNEGFIPVNEVTPLEPNKDDDENKATMVNSTVATIHINDDEIEKNKVEERLHRPVAGSQRQSVLLSIFVALISAIVLLS
uniref:CPG4 domain-containing protein n=1 Tax=Syphacia muris TaxID=451379 RepID=A0A0N5AH52_9BILA